MSEEYKQCPFCSEQILAEAIRCKHCKSDLNESRQPNIVRQKPAFSLPQSSTPQTSPAFGFLHSKLAGYLIIGGVLGAVYFFLFFDTSVAVPNGEILGIDRVNNLGLMSDRQNGMLFCLAIAATGAVIEFFARSRK